MSRQDARFAGTTTFAAIVDLDRLARQLGESDAPVQVAASVNSNATLKTLPPVITLGVITIARQDQRSLPEGHGASRFAMQFLRDLVAGASTDGQ